MAVSFPFRGLMAPGFTPFNNDKERSFNLGLIPRYAKYIKDLGIDGVVVNGTTGEGVSQTVEEREQLAEAWLSACKALGQTVIVQVGGCSFKDVQRLTAHAEKHGADGLLCLADLFNHPKNADELLRFMKVVGESAPNTPLMYYHIPEFTGININMREFLEKATVEDNPTLVGIKYTCEDLALGPTLLHIQNGRFVVFLGDDFTIAPAYLSGFDSGILGTVNMFPHLTKSVIAAIEENDVAKSREAQNALNNAIHTVLKQGPWVPTMKATMNLLSSFDFGPVREPLQQLSPKQLGALKSDLSALGLL